MAEQNICKCDPVKNFCEEYISKHRDNWPTGETELADAFVKHFEIPPLINIGALAGFAAHTKIDLVQDDIPGDLLGLNMSFGMERKIFVSRDPRHIGFQMHTLLHEIREVFENNFRSLGFGTVGSDQLELRADEFAFVAFILSGAETFKEFIGNAAQYESPWHKWPALGLTVVGGILMVLYSLVAAFCSDAVMPSVDGAGR